MTNKLLAKSFSKFCKRGNLFNWRLSLKWAVYSLIIYFSKGKIPLEITTPVNMMNFSSVFKKKKNKNIALKYTTT